MKELVEVYGFKGDSMTDIARYLEQQLEIKFARRYGDNMNGDYFRYSSNPPGEVDALLLTLANNDDPMGQAPMCDFAPDCDFILNVSQHGEVSKIEAAIASMSDSRGVLLKRVLWDGDDPKDRILQYQRPPLAG